MSDEATFSAAVAASPDDDLPRLVFADWLDDRGESERAEFVRAQVQCAATPAWEPFAVYCRHRRPEWTTGDPWRTTLPWVQGWAVEWHPDRAFRRGFGHSLLIRDMTAFLADAPRLFDAAPIDELHLPTATLDQWRAFGRAKWLPRVKSVHFYGTTTPIEPVRVLCESPLATGIEEIVFEVCSRPGMPVLLEGLFESELGRRLKSLELRSGPEDPNDLFAAFAAPEALPSLARISFVRMNFADRYNLIHVRNRVEGLVSVSLDTCTDSLDVGRYWMRWRELRQLMLERSDLGRWLNSAGSETNAPHPSFPRTIRSFRLRASQLADAGTDWIRLSKTWPHLTELDLRDNRITDTGAKHLLAAPVPPDLTALLLGGNPISDDVRTKLRRHFGPAVLFDE